MQTRWWQRTNVYQIYPRSFMDSNGDGIGDIPGIISRLDYLKKLGVETIWLSPVNASPNADNGYDISDYYRIDEQYGTNEDFDRLIGEAGARGMKIVMDLVVNHCSTEHRWFKEAVKDPEGPFADYFYFRKGKDGGAPNNWRSVFGGSAWEPVPGSDYWYLHMFTKGQADLNWENEALREEIYAMMNWWLGKGVAGFRIDAINYLKKEPGLPGFPADGDDGLVSPRRGSLYRPGIEKFLTEMRERTYGREALTVGEVAGVPDEDLMKFVSLEDGYFSMIFDFSFNQLDCREPRFAWCERREWEVEELKEKLFATQETVQPKGWIADVLESHDSPRSMNYYLPEEGRNFLGGSMLAVMSTCRRGTPFLYQGQELGMDNQPFDSIDVYDDCSSHNEYAYALSRGYSPEEALHFVHLRSRDNARYPFSWDASEKAGFTTGTPWLPVTKRRREINAADQVEKPRSLFNVYRFLLALRREGAYAKVLTEGAFIPWHREQKNLLAYERVLTGEPRLLVVCNYQKEGQDISLPGRAKVLFDNTAFGTEDPLSEPVSGTLSLVPWQAAVFEILAE